MTHVARNAALFASAICLAGGAVAIAAAPAQASVVCNLEVVSVRALELNDNDGRDEMKIRLGNDPVAGPWDMFDGQTRTGSLGQLDEDFIGSLDVTLYEQDLTRQTIDTDSVACTVDDDLLLELAGNGAIYEMVVDVTLS